MDAKRSLRMFAVDVLSKSFRPVGYSIQFAIKDVDHDALWLVKVAQKLENTVQLVGGLGFLSCAIEEVEHRATLRSTSSFSLKSSTSSLKTTWRRSNSNTDLNSIAASLSLWTTVLFNQQYTVDGVATYNVVFTVGSADYELTGNLVISTSSEICFCSRVTAIDVPAALGGSRILLWRPRCPVIVETVSD